MRNSNISQENNLIKRKIISDPVNSGYGKTKLESIKIRWLAQFFLSINMCRGVGVCVCVCVCNFC